MVSYRETRNRYWKDMETRLSGRNLQHKENRDQELADILSGMMIVSFWSLGLVRLIMKKQSLSMLVVWQICRKSGR